MGRPFIATKQYWLKRVGRSVALGWSAGAAAVSVLWALFEYGMIGQSEAHQSIGNIGAAWVRVNPEVDTAFSIGDTLHFAATIADRNGSVLIGAKPTWTTGDSSIATATSSGEIVARRPGTTTVSAIVGSLVARSQVVVRPRVAGIVVSSSAGDNVATLPEGGQIQLRARAVDARGHTVMQAGAAWRVDDTVVAHLDSSGLLRARHAGASVVSARIDGKAGYLPITVVTIAARLDVVGGGDQRAPAGRALPQPVVVRATNRRGEPVAGKTVTFRVAEGIGKVEPAVAITDADGRARTTWTLGTFPGRQSVFANVEDVDSVTVVMAESDPVAANTRLVAITEQLTGRAGDTLSDTVSIRLTDTTGRVLADVPVHWTALDGGEVQAIDVRTDSLGIARARWALGGKTGMQRLRAHVGGGTASREIPPVTIRASAAAGAAADVIVVSGDKQRGAAGGALKRPIVLRVVDAKGNGVRDIPLVLSLSAGAVADSMPKTDSTGTVTMRWTMGRSASAHSLAVHVDGVKQTLKVTATATPAAAANLSFEDAPAEKNARPGSKRLYALVTDIYGNPIADAPVTFTTKTGTVTPARAVTDAKGRVLVRWTPGTGTDEKRLSGAVRGTDVKGAYITTGVRPTRKP